MDEKNIQAYPLCWPDGWKRTPASDRRYGGDRNKFEAVVQARKDALSEVA